MKSDSQTLTATIDDSSVALPGTITELEEVTMMHLNRIVQTLLRILECQSRIESREWLYVCIRTRVIFMHSFLSRPNR